MPLVAGGEDPAEGEKSGEVDAFEQGSVGDEEGGAGIFELVADLALAVGGIEKSRDGAGEGGGVIGDCKFPGVGQEDGDDLPGSKPGGDQAAGERLDQFGIFRIREATIAGSIDKRSFAGIAAATLQNKVVNEKAGRIGVELCT